MTSTPEKLRDRERRRHYGGPPCKILDPTASEVLPLFTSRLDDCLTHITRYASQHSDIDGKTRTTGFGWCGVQMSRCRFIAESDASGFACHKCIDKAEHYGAPTFSMVPDTGCAVSGGKRGQRLGTKYPNGHYAKHWRH